ncbi:hypothetical protein KIL84_005350 [Mauremys mutica]|uniref:Uncharacterized protein n=1 Tax=Mauremys mutica TaxID=74926 RepID=A0A9D3XJB4_9SAUR|nr:hypothetical protein KIL84_005350 [Mauremys mutica]
MGYQGASQKVVGLHCRLLPQGGVAARACHLEGVHSGDWERLSEGAAYLGTVTGGGSGTAQRPLLGHHSSPGVGIHISWWTGSPQISPLHQLVSSWHEVLAHPVQSTIPTPKTPFPPTPQIHGSAVVPASLEACRGASTAE